MVTTMRILGWKTEGLRCPDHEIDCRGTTGKPARTLLVQMPNGTGKTTTLTLLRAALAGLAETPLDRDWNSNRVRELRKQNSDREDGYFELRLAHNEKLITIVMEFDFETGRVYYKTTKDAGQEEGFDPPRDLRRFMQQTFVDYYVFDGELAENLLSPEETHAEIAVESLFQLNLLKNMKQKISDYWTEKTSKVTAKDKKGYTRRKNLLDRWNVRLVGLLNEQQELDAERSRIKANLAKLRARYETKIAAQESLAEKVKSSRSQLDRRMDKVDDVTTALLDRMREPHALSSAFGSVMSELKSGLDRLKLPEGVAREFFQELAEDEECVCGRSIDADIRMVIRQRASRYLASENVTLLNVVKSAVSEAVGDAPDRAPRQLSHEIEHLSEYVEAEFDAKNDYDQLRLEAETSDPTLQSTKDRINKLERRRRDLEVALERFTGRDSGVDLDRLGSVDLSRIFAIDTIIEGIKILEGRLAEVANTRKLRKKRDILTKLIDNAFHTARQAITSDIRDEANQRIKSLMPNNNIRIHRIDGCLHLRSQSKGSVGENLSIAYAFLSTLFHRADQHQLPFIVDSPANSIDLETRPNIAALVPKLTGQFIAFVISSEREGFVPNLKKHSDDDIKFITVFRRGTDYDGPAIANPLCRQTKDGISVSGEDFFNEFQTDNGEF